MIIDETKMENALNFLAETDEDYARVKSLVSGLERQTKIIKAQAFKYSRESSATAKEQDAYQSMSYQQHIQKIEVAELEMFILQEKRNTAVTTIDCWRSLNASRRHGA